MLVFVQSLRLNSSLIPFEFADSILFIPLRQFHFVSTVTSLGGPHTGLFPESISDIMERVFVCVCVRSTHKARAHLCVCGLCDLFAMIVHKLAVRSLCVLFRHDTFFCNMRASRRGFDARAWHRTTACNENTSSKIDAFVNRMECH